MDESPPRSGPVDLTSRAMDELAAECRIPADLEEQILGSVVGSEEPSPVIRPKSEPSPLGNVIRLTREDNRRQTWINRALLLAAAALVVTMLAAPKRAPSRSASHPAPTLLAEPTSVTLRGNPPAGLRGTEVPLSHPRLIEARSVMLVTAERIVSSCNAQTWSAVVRFENTGVATVLDIESSEPRSIGCVEGEVARAKVRPTAGRRLAVRYERLASVSRIAGWLLDET